VPPPGATTLPADAGAAPGNTDQTPTAAAGSPSAAASAPASAPMATTLGLRLVAAASNLVTQPLRTPLASLTQPQDKAAAAQPATAGHTALALDMLQGTPKTAADPTANVGTKLLDAAAKDIVAVQVATVEHVGVTATSAEPTAAPAGAGNDALVAQMAATPAAAAPSSAAASPPPALPMMAHGAAEQVAVSLRQAVKGDVDHIQIQLQPAELGAIAIKLNVNHDGRVTVVVSADRSDTLNLLQHDASTLAQALRDAGLQADNSSLSFNLRGFQMNHQATQGGSSWRDGTSGGGDDLGAAASLTPMLRRHSGALDIHV
jgi:flagellar hook-length control protein FliK